MSGTTISQEGDDLSRTDQDLVRLAASAAAEKKAIDIQALDVGELLGITDWFLIVSGTTPRQVRTIAEAIEVACKRAGCPPRRVEGRREGEWVLIDFGDLVAHIFTEETRDFYNLEGLWSDAPRLDLAELERVER